MLRVTEKGNYTEKDAASLIKQILEGVAYLHSQGEHDGRLAGHGQLASSPGEMICMARQGWSAHSTIGMDPGRMRGVHAEPLRPM